MIEIPFSERSWPLGFGWYDLTVFLCGYCVARAEIVHNSTCSAGTYTVRELTYYNIFFGIFSLYVFSFAFNEWAQERRFGSNVFNQFIDRFCFTYIYTFIYFCDGDAAVLSSHSCLLWTAFAYSSYKHVCSVMILRAIAIAHDATCKQ